MMRIYTIAEDETAIDDFPEVLAMPTPQPVP
jgi:hypothetical protein